MARTTTEIQRDIDRLSRAAGNPESEIRTADGGAVVYRSELDRQRAISALRSELAAATAAEASPDAPRVRTAFYFGKTGY